MHTPDDDPSPLTPAERELENALKALSPNASGVDPTELAYRLGEATARRRVRRWQGIAGGAALMGMAIGVISLSVRPPAPAARGVQGNELARGATAPDELRAETAPTPGGMAGWLAVSEYARQRARTLRLGPDVLSVEPGPPAPPSPGPESVDGAGAGPAPREQSDLDLFLIALTSGRRL